MNLMAVYGRFEWTTSRIPVPPLAAREVAAIAPRLSPAQSLPPGSRILMIGEATAFYFPSGTLYATCFDANPLAELAAEDLTPQQLVEALRRRSITHLWVDWSEIWRLASTYGYPAQLSAGLFDRAEAGRPPGLDVLDRLKAAGMREVTSVRPASKPAKAPATSRADDDAVSEPSRPIATTRPTTRPWLTWPADWPVATLYELPK
jgi:hypothetical protein